MWPGSVEINKQSLDGPKWGTGNSSTLSDSNPWHSKDSMTSGWGSVNQSPVPNAGTEGWSSTINQQLQQNNGNGLMLPHSNFSSNHSQQPTNTVSNWGAASSVGPTGAWSRGNPMVNTVNQASTSSASNQTPGAGGPSSWAEAVASKQPNNNASSGLISAGLPSISSASVPTASNQPVQTTSEEAKALAKKTQEEIIALAINSHEGWGKTVIRQDTAWIIDDPPAPNEASNKDPHLEHDQQNTAALTSKQIITGTAIWESLKAPQKPAEITTAWETGKAATVVANGPSSDILNNSQQSFRQTALDNKSTLSSVNWPIQASTNSNSTTSTLNWGSVGSVVGPSSSDISWGDASAAASGALKKEDDRPLWGLSSTSEIGSKSSTDLGISCWDRASLPLHRSSSTGSWIEETTTPGLDLINTGVAAGWNDDKTNSSSVLNEIDDGTSLWGDPGQNKAQQLGWRPGSVLASKSSNSMRKSESEVFCSSNVGLKLGYGNEDLSRAWNTSIPPPCTEPSPGWGASDVKDNLWMGLFGQNQRLKAPFRGSNDITDWSALSNNRMIFDTKGQPPQRSALLQKLINMGFKKEEAQAALISNNMNYDEAMTMLLKAKVPGPLVLDHTLSSSSTPAPGRFNSNSTRTLTGGMEDVLNIDSGALDLIGLSNLSINPNNSNINGVTSSLVNQLRGGANNAALHQFASSLGNVNLDFSALFTPGSAVPQLQVGKPLAPLAPQQHNRPMPSLPQQQSPFMQQLFHCVQSAVQLGLLPPQAINQHTLMNPSFYSSVQMLLKLHENQKLLIQSMQQVPPPGHASGSVLSQQQQQQQQIIECTSLQQHIETLKQQLIQMAVTVSAPISVPSTSSTLIPLSSRLISQWKVTDGNASSIVNNDVNRLQHSSSLLESSEPATTTSSTWLPITSSSTSSWLSGDTPINNALAPSDQKSSLVSSSVTTTPSQTSSLPDSNSVSAAIAALDIEEFVPGKPWQGPGTKNAEDDPYLTPGSLVRNSISTVKDSHTANILGKANYPSLSNTSTPSANPSNLNNSLDQRAPPTHFPSSKIGPQWVPDSRSSDLWPASSFSANKPGAGQWNAMNRSISWASGDRADSISSSTAAMSNNWSMPSAPSNWLLIKSIPQVDNHSLQGLCLQNGVLFSFMPNFHQGQTLVGFVRLEDAIKAYRQMSPCRLVNSVIKAEFISEAEVSQFINRVQQQQQQQQQQLAAPSGGFQQGNNGLMGAVGGAAGLMGNSGLLGSGPAFFGKLPLPVPPGGDPSLLAGMRAPHHWGTGMSGGGVMGHLWNNQASPAGQQSLWGGGVGLEDHDHSVYLPGDLLGSQ